jgi:uncharacterized protein
MSSNVSLTPPFLGFGLGLRTEHYNAILESKPNVDWFEVLSENYMIPGGKPLDYLDKIRADYPVVTGVHGQNMHDLLPLPYTPETAKHVAERVKIVQDYLGHQILLENVSSYASYIDSTMTEWEFINEIAEAADCLLLLDVNNIYVSSYNHNFDAKAFIDGVPAKRIQQIHLAGHQNNGDYIIDTHDAPVIDPVWDLYEYAIAKLGVVSTMIERDDHIPELGELVQELQIARDIAAKTLKAAA